MLNIHLGKDGGTIVRDRHIHVRADQHFVHTSGPQRSSHDVADLQVCEGGMKQTSPTPLLCMQDTAARKRNTRLRTREHQKGTARAA